VLDEQVFHAGLLLEAWNEDWFQNRNISRNISLSTLYARSAGIEHNSEKKESGHFYRFNEIRVR
jgi:hypothetical protein